MRKSTNKPLRAKTLRRDRIVVGLALSPDLHAKVKAAAGEDRRTVSQFVRLMIERNLEEQKSVSA